jgi:outer membrane protein TolC
LSLQKQNAALSIAPTEPTFSINYNDLNKAFNVPNSASTSYLLTQPIAFPGKAWVNKSALDHQSRSIFYQLRSKELDIANTVKTTYYQLALAQQNLELNAETKASYERILAIAKRRYEAGAITQVDLLNSEIALYSNLNDLADLETTAKTTLAQLNALLGRPLDAVLTVEPIKVLGQKISKPILAPAEAEDKMTESRAEINSAKELSAAAEKSYTLAKMSLLPDFQLTGGTTTYNFAPASPLANGSGATQTFMVGLQLTVPIWGLLNERETVVAASHDKATAEANLASINIQSKTALESSLENLKSLQKKISNYEDHLLALSEQAFRSAMVSYSSGKIDFQTLAEAATVRRQVRHDYYGLIINYLTSYSAYGQLIGEDL